MAARLPRGWASDVARTYPQIDVVGVDISQKMIRHAQAHARTQGLDNASFQVMDVLKPLEFPDDAFEFVIARFISPFMPKEAWPNFLQEC
jgi:ubiquinone/menaquinone biosynthesis C-methylase UbiE